MKKITRLFLATALGSIVLFASCVKDKDKDKDNVISKKGLDLSPGQENPPVASKASGKMDVSYNKMSKTLSFEVNWMNLSNTPTGAHIHGPAPRGMNAGIKYDFFSLFPKTTSGTFSNSVVVDGVRIKEDSLLMGFYYVNIHSATFPGGEIRGQIEFK
jgi:hypothetical protein